MPPCCKTSLPGAGWSPERLLKRARPQDCALGFNHVALEVGDLDEGHVARARLIHGTPVSRLGPIGSDLSRLHIEYPESNVSGAYPPRHSHHSPLWERGRG